MSTFKYCIATLILIVLISGCSGNSNTLIPTSSQTDELEPNATDLLDTDKDGTVDSTDDDDGFLDSNDISPLDMSIPGDFSTPESILSQLVVHTAIEEASSQGFSIDALTSTTPPNIGGYYREEQNSTVFVASDNLENIGDTRSGAEFRYDQLPDKLPQK